MLRFRRRLFLVVFCFRRFSIVNVVNIKDIWMMIMAEKQGYSFPYFMCLFQLSLVAPEYFFVSFLSAFLMIHFRFLSYISFLLKPFMFNAICRDWCRWCQSEITIYCAIERIAKKHPPLRDSSEIWISVKERPKVKQKLKLDMNYYFRLFAVCQTRWVGSWKHSGLDSRTSAKVSFPVRDVQTAFPWTLMCQV